MCHRHCQRVDGIVYAWPYCFRDTCHACGHGPDIARSALRGAPKLLSQTNSMLKKMFAAVLMTLSTAAIAVPFGSQSILVVEDGTG